MHSETVKSVKPSTDFHETWDELHAPGEHHKATN